MLKSARGIAHSSKHPEVNHHSEWTGFSLCGLIQFSLNDVRWSTGCPGCCTHTLRKAMAGLGLCSTDKECSYHVIPNTVERGLTGKHLFFRCICKGRKKENNLMLRIRITISCPAFFPSKAGHLVHNFCNSVEVRAVDKDMQEKESWKFSLWTLP